VAVLTKKLANAGRIRFKRKLVDLRSALRAGPSARASVGVTRLMHHAVAAHAGSIVEHFVLSLFFALFIRNSGENRLNY
jgi:hypothetical protein